MSSYNRVILMGNLTADPEVRYTPQGTAVCDFNLAINRKWKDANGQAQEDVDFIGCVAFAKQAEMLGQYFRKGRPLMLEGRLSQDSWEDKNTGQKRSKTRVLLEKLVFLPRNEGNGNGVNHLSSNSQPSSSGVDLGARNIAGQTAGEVAPEDDDDVPF